MPVLPLARFLGVLALAAATCSAQTGRPSPSPSPTPTPPTTTSPTTTRPTTQPTQDNFPNDQPRPIFLSGKVILDDGNPPPESVVIERVCGSRITQEGYTDSKGHFSVELGRNRTMFMDASLGSADSMDSRMDSSGSNSANRPNIGGVTERSLMSCELRASLAGFRSDAVSLATRHSLDNPEVGTIILHRRANVEGLTISATTLNAPKDAKKAFEKGKEAAKKGKLDEAAKQLDKAVELYPKFALAWYERGRVYEGQDQLDKAESAYAEALKADPKLISPYERLAYIDVHKQKWQDAADTSARMIRLNPIDFPQAYFFNALANFNMKKLDEAEKSADELLKMDKQHAFVKGEHLMAVIKAQKADWQDAAVHFRAYIQYARPGDSVELAKKQLAEVEKTLAAANTEKQD